MTPDSVPAPMVQVPADKVEKLREAVEVQARARQGGTSHAADWSLTKAARAVVDAATPAASVSAADILALADEWENYDAEGYAAGDGPDWWTRTDQLRALVAAEQADKGEAAEDDEQPVNQNCRVCLGYTHPLDEHATGCPAAPVSEPCQCDAMGVPTGYHNWRCTNFHVDDERLVPPARVPVNDEAEAAWQAFDEENILDPDGFAHTAFKAGFRAARGEGV